MWAELRWKDVTTPWRTDQAAHSCEPGQSGWILKGRTEEEGEEEEEEEKEEEEDNRESRQWQCRGRKPRKERDIDKGKGILFNVGGQTGKDCLLTWADGVKVADRRDRTRNLLLRKRCTNHCTTGQGDDSACKNDAKQQVLKVAKSDSGITRHLKTSSKCRDVVCRSSITSRFKVIARARNARHLGFLEALFIGWYTPELCAQKKFVRTLGLL